MSNIFKVLLLRGGPTQGTNSYPPSMIKKTPVAAVLLCSAKAQAGDSTRARLPRPHHTHWWHQMTEKRVGIYCYSTFNSFQGNNLRSQDVYADNGAPCGSARAPRKAHFEGGGRVPGAGERLAAARSGRAAGHPRWQQPARPGPCRHMLGLFLPVFLPTVCAFDIRERQGVINIQLCLLTIVSHI